MSVIEGASPAVRRAVQDLVIANRVLAHQGVLDAYGHVSARNPDRPERYFLSRSRAPELVSVEDVVEFELDGTPIGDDRPPYIERFIHGSLYAARPDFACVLHAHTESLLPFSVTDIPLVPVVHDASEMGSHVPVWDIRDRFGDGTSLLVRTREMGDDLAAALGGGRVALMRGHGFAGGGRAISQVVRMAVYMARNAEVLTNALLLGGTPIPLSEGEIAARDAFDPESPASRRSWEYWAQLAECADLL